jgi:hypothetical protein
MMKRTLCLVSAFALLTACGSQAAAIPKQPPNAAEAKQAIATMFGEGAGEMIKAHEIVLGTCIATPAKYKPKPGQFSCTFLLKSPGGTSESKVDFYFKNKAWVAQPSSTDEELPFPDPKLMSSNAG